MKTLDLNSEFLMAMHDFITENRWSWRNKVTTLQLQAGVWQYNLTDPDGANAADLQQFAKHGVRYYPNAPRPESAEITPMFERSLMTVAIYQNQFFPTKGSPSKYFMMPGQFLVLCLAPPPDQGYPVTLHTGRIPRSLPIRFLK